ncbi:MAG TPA: acyltransferase [Syntrophomonadaceae bacterium]|nr:acyltransferase [Syntrophomonadaceae bacterium]
MQRAGELDWLRALAALTVIAIHITGSYVDFLSSAYYANHLARFAVPLFIIISGFVLHYSNRRKEMTVLSFYQRRMDRILWPYLVWTLFYVFFFPPLMGQGFPWVSAAELGRHLLWGTGSYHLYFLPIIIQLYLLFPLLYRWVKKQPWVMLLVALLISLLSMSLYYLGMLQESQWWNDYKIPYMRFFPNWLFYFVLGMVAAERQELMNRLCKRYVLPLGILWLGALGLILLDSRLCGMAVSIVRPSILIYASLSFLFFYGIFRYLPAQWSAVRWLAEQSFVVYLAHPGIISLLVYWLPAMGYQTIWYNNNGMCLLYLCTLGITLLFCWGVSQLPGAQYLGGVNRGK